MLDIKYRTRFVQLLQGDIKTGDLADDEAIIFAHELFLTVQKNPRQFNFNLPSEIPDSPDKSRRFLVAMLEAVDQGFEQTTVTSLNLADDAFGKETDFGDRRWGASVDELPKGGTVTDKWNSLTAVCNRMVGEYYANKCIILTNYEGAPRNTFLLNQSSGYTFISPQYEKWLINSNLLRPISAAAKKPPNNNWQSSVALKKSGKYVGSDQKIYEALAKFQQLLIAYLQTEKPEQEAKTWVEENAVGQYRGVSGKTTLFASPWAVEQMEKEGLLKLQYISKAPDNWQTSNSLYESHHYIGNQDAIKNALEQFREQCLLKILSEELSAAQAEAWVAENAVGQYRSERGKPTLYASPWAVEQMEKEGLLKLQSHGAPHVKAGWKSTNGLIESGEYIGSTNSVREQFVAFRKQLVLLAVADGLTQDQADKWVEENLIGTYREKSRQETLFASPQAIEWMIQEKILKLQTEAVPHAKAGWKSSRDAYRSGQYSGGDNALRKKFLAFREETIACLQAAGANHQTAEEWVENNLIGTYREEQAGKEAIFASPYAIDWMKNTQLLKPKKPSRQRDDHGSHER